LYMVRGEIEGRVVSGETQGLSTYWGICNVEPRL
jgi:hypothetical protein